MLSNKDVFTSTYKGKDGVKVTVRHRVTGLSVEMECAGSVAHPDDGPDVEYCNPNECADNLRAMALEELSKKVAWGWMHHYNS